MLFQRKYKFPARHLFPSFTFGFLVPDLPPTDRLLATRTYPTLSCPNAKGRDAGRQQDLNRPRIWLRRRTSGVPWATPRGAVNKAGRQDHGAKARPGALGRQVRFGCEIVAVWGFHPMPQASYSRAPSHCARAKAAAQTHQVNLSIASLRDRVFTLICCPLMTYNPALLRAASAVLLVVLFHPHTARADAITGTIVLGGATPVTDGGVPLADATYLRSGDILTHFSGDLIGADPEWPNLPRGDSI